MASCTFSKSSCCCSASLLRSPWSTCMHAACCQPWLERVCNVQLFHAQACRTHSLLKDRTEVAQLAQDILLVGPISIGSTTLGHLGTLYYGLNARHVPVAQFRWDDVLLLTRASRNAHKYVTL